MIFRQAILLLLAAASSSAKSSHADANLRGEIVDLSHENGSHAVELPTKSLMPLTRMEVSAEKPGQEDVTIEPGAWGVWKGWAGTPIGGYYACGAEVRAEDWADHQDDTAANGLKLTYCHLQNWNAQKIEVIYAGAWGTWKGVKYCNMGSYVDGAQIRFEGWNDKQDDTALNGLKIHCRNFETGEGEWVMVYEGSWGDWKTQTIRSDKYVTLANLRSEDWKDNQDDTAWNGLAFRYEFPNNGTSLEPMKGFWNNIASGPSVKNELMESMETTEGKTLSKEESSSISSTMSVGYSFLGVDTSVSVTGSYAQSTTTAVSSTIAMTQQVTTTVSCPTMSSETGIWFMYQWIMEQDADPTGPGFKMSSSHYRCVPSMNQAPKCPVGMCVDSLCQTCTGPLSSNTTDDKVEVA